MTKKQKKAMAFTVAIHKAIHAEAMRYKRSQTIMSIDDMYFFRDLLLAVQNRFYAGLLQRKEMV